MIFVSLKIAFYIVLNFVLVQKAKKIVFVLLKLSRNAFFVLQKWFFFFWILSYNSLWILWSKSIQATCRFLGIPFWTHFFSQKTGQSTWIFQDLKTNLNVKWDLWPKHCKIFWLIIEYPGFVIKLLIPTTSSSCISWSSSRYMLIVLQSNCNWLMHLWHAGRRICQYLRSII